MQAWLVSSAFTSVDPDGGLCLAAAERTSPSPEGASNARVRSIGAGDTVLLWDLGIDALTRILRAGAGVPRESFFPRTRSACRRLEPVATLPPGLDREWLAGINGRHLAAASGFKLFRDRAGGILFHRRAFCRPVPAAALAEIEALVPSPRPRARQRSRPPLPSRGPAPATGSRVVEFDASVPAHCYLARFGATSTWKVGWADDPVARMDDLNRHMPIGPDGGGLGWSLVASRPWGSRRDAHAAEQETLSRLVALRVGGEQVRGPPGAVRGAWDEVNGAGALRPPSSPGPSSVPAPSSFGS